MSWNVSVCFEHKQTIMSRASNQAEKYERIIYTPQPSDLIVWLGKDKKTIVPNACPMPRLGERNQTLKTSLSFSRPTRTGCQAAADPDRQFNDPYFTLTCFIPPPRLPFIDLCHLSTACSCAVFFLTSGEQRGVDIFQAL